jgi:hypothetical protein
MTEYGKHGKPKSRLSTLPTLLGNPFGITTFSPSTQKFTDLGDLKSVPGVDASTVDTKNRLIFFK